MAFLETGTTMSPWYNRDLNSGYISDNILNKCLKNLNLYLKINLIYFIIHLTHDQLVRNGKNNNLILR